MVFGFIAEVPFAKDPGGVAGGFEHLGDCRRVEREALAFEDRVGHAVFEFVPTGHERRAGRRTGGADHEIGEADRFGMEPIEVFGF